MIYSTSGPPNATVDVVDATNLLVDASGGGICVQGETLRGEPGKAVFIGSVPQFKRLLGGLHPVSPFPAYCLRLLNQGVPLWVSRAAHYTSPADRSTVSGTKATGTITVSSSVTATFRAKHVGPGYNGLTVTVQAPASFATGVFDLVVTVPDSDQTQTVQDVAATPTAGQLLALNQKLEHVDMVSGTLSVATVTLAGGVQDVTAITAADYQGDVMGGTGWYAFGGVTDSFRIANLHKPTALIDAGLLAYVVARGDMRCHLGLPMGANAAGMEDYRMGTGAYSHTPINSWQANFVGGNTIGNDGVNLEVNISIPGIVEALASIYRKDKVAPWLSAATEQFGQVLAFNRGVPYNLMSPDLSADFGRIYARGVNAIVNNPRARLWGNRSGLLDQTKILSKENVADLMIYMTRTFKPIFTKQAFEPNDPQMWSSIYRNALVVIEDLEKRRAIIPGEGTNWFWQGDQTVTNPAQAVYNTQEDLANGKYKAGFVFRPIASTEYLTLTLTATDANTIAAVVSQGSTN